MLLRAYVHARALARASLRRPSIDAYACKPDERIASVSRTIPHDHLQREIYGVALEWPLEVIQAYIPVLLKIVGGDGEVSDMEWDYLLGRARAMGIPDELIHSWTLIDHHEVDLKSAVQKLYEVAGSDGSYAFLYDAIKVSSADGYHEAERELLLAAAETLEIPLALVQQIEALVRIEEQVRRMRVELLYPQRTKFHNG